MTANSYDGGTYLQAGFTRVRVHTVGTPQFGQRQLQPHQHRLDLRIATLAPPESRSTADGSPAEPATNQGRLMDAGKSAMFQG